MSFSWPSASAALYIAGQLTRLSGAVDSDDTPTELTRFAGGHNRTTQPHITGYHHILIYLPEVLFATGLSESQRWLSVTCESFTPHSYVINTGDVIGMGQTAVSFPTSRTTNREFTLGFREYQGLPILSIIKSWHSIFDPFFGASPFGSLVVSPSTYKGMVIVAIVKPTCDKNSKISREDIEEAYIYHGAFPTTCPEDTITSSDQSSNESPIASVTFKFDGAPMDLGTPVIPGVLDVGQIVVEAFDSSGYDYNNVYTKIGQGLPKS